MKAHLLDLYRYNNKCNVTMISTCMGVDGELDAQIVKLFSHVLNAHSIWNSRIAVEAVETGGWDLQPETNWLGLHEQNQMNSLDIIEGCQLDDLTKYSNSLGKEYVNSVQDILFHVISHSTHHRAQIATILSSLGVRVVASDFIMYKRG